jgi:hypothetical protein
VSGGYLGLECDGPASADPAVVCSTAASASGQGKKPFKITHDTGKLRIAYTTTVPQNFNPEFDLGPEAELTCLANMGSDSWENHRPMPDVVNKNSNSTVVEAYDLFRRLGRLDLQHHYPELGVKDLSSCGPPVKFDDDDGDLAQGCRILRIGSL